MQKIQNIISEIIKSLYSIDFSPEISPAPKKELGEYCVNIFPIVKQVGKAPNMISEEVASELRKHDELFKGTSATGGYVNFFLTDNIWQEIFSALPSLEPRAKNGKKAIMEIFSSNVGKPLHIGHLCPTSTGQTIVNIHKHLGWEIIIDNHMGDWGSLFGKLIVGFERYGSYDELEKVGVDHLQDLYVKINADIESDPSVDELCKDAFLRLSQGDSRLMEMWGKFTRKSLDQAYIVTKRLYIETDVAIGEAFYEGLPLPKIGDYPDLEYTMDDIVRDLIEKGVATKNEDGSVGIVYPEEMRIPSTILEKRDGTHGYLASDLACMRYRIDHWGVDKISIGTDIRQELHFRQVFAAARMAGYVDPSVELVHVTNGFISLPDGAMSSRKGNIIRLEDLIDEGIDRTRTILESKGRNLREEDIEKIAIGAIKYSYLMQDRERNIVFDWDKALSFEGNSGPYIQYAYVRARKITSGIESRKSGINKDRTHDIGITNYDKELIQILARFDEVVDTVANTYKPHHLALYAYDLAGGFNSFYVHTPRILEETDEDLRYFRLSLVEKTTKTLEKAFGLLAIKMPSQM